MASDGTKDGTQRVLPGERHVVRDMDLATKLVTLDRCLVRAPLTEAVSTSAGTASLGMLMTLVDVGASEPALATCRPDWTATQDLAVHATGWLAEGPVVVDTHLVRVGKKMIVVAADIYDSHGTDDFDELQTAIDGSKSAGDRRASNGSGITLAGRGLLTFVRVPGTAVMGLDDHNPASWVGQVRHRGVEQPPDGTMFERMELRMVDGPGGVVELDRTPYVANNLGTINGGAQAVLIEAAATAMRPGLVATDMQLHYLSQVKAGPARTSGTVSRDAEDHSVVVIELVDAGHDAQLLALATVTLQRPPS
jgi:acyl-coenzyme A thioesterase PaaI-like protein